MLIFQCCSDCEQCNWTHKVRVLHRTHSNSVRCNQKACILVSTMMMMLIEDALTIEDCSFAERVCFKPGLLQLPEAVVSERGESHSFRSADLHSLKTWVKTSAVPKLSNVGNVWKWKTFYFPTCSSRTERSSSVWEWWFPMVKVRLPPERVRSASVSTKPFQKASASKATWALKARMLRVAHRETP